MKVESAAVAALAVCISLSFYFALLTFQSEDDFLKRQLVTFAAASIVTSIIIVASLIMVLVIRETLKKETPLQMQ